MPSRCASRARPLLIVVAGLVVVLATGCGTGLRSSESITAPAASDADVRLLAIGDSVLAFSGEKSTPQAVGTILESQGVSAFVENRAIRGSCLIACGDPDTEQIPARYIDGDWTHILVSGGGNDLGDLDGVCASPDSLMSADLSSGAMVELIDRMPSDAVVLLYRYSIAVDEDDPRVCPQIWMLLDRYEAFAAERANVVLADASTVTGASTPELWADKIHPNEKGSQVLGQMIADLILDPSLN